MANWYFFFNGHIHKHVQRLTQLHHFWNYTNYISVYVHALMCESENTRVWFDYSLLRLMSSTRFPVKYMTNHWLLIKKLLNYQVNRLHKVKRFYWSWSCDSIWKFSLGVNWVYQWKFACHYAIEIVSNKAFTNTQLAVKNLHCKAAIFFHYQLLK